MQAHLTLPGAEQAPPGQPANPTAPGSSLAHVASCISPVPCCPPLEIRSVHSSHPSSNHLACSTRALHLTVWIRCTLTPLSSSADGPALPQADVSDGPICQANPPVCTHFCVCTAVSLPRLLHATHTPQRPTHTHGTHPTSAAKLKPASLLHFIYPVATPSGGSSLCLPLIRISHLGDSNSQSPFEPNASTRVIFPGARGSLASAVPPA